MGRMQWRGLARALEIYPEMVPREDVDLIFDRVKRTRRLGDKYMSALALAGIEDLGGLDVATQIGATQFVAAIIRLSVKVVVAVIERLRNMRLTDHRLFLRAAELTIQFVLAPHHQGCCLDTPLVLSPPPAVCLLPQGVPRRGVH